MFNHRDVQEILRIPLWQVGEKDIHVWRLGRDCNYSVKSAYHHLMEHIVDNSHLRHLNKVSRRLEQSIEVECAKQS